MSCLCDQVPAPAALVIAPGLSRLPRQIDSFSGFRRQLLAASDLAEFAALAGWKGDADGDLGLMLLEMTAYVFDVLAFYDQVYANESYLRTAQLPQSLRGLVDLIGYLARPAVGARVELALQADGRQSVTVPAGTAFRSSAFRTNAPQVFELDRDASALSFFNKLPIAPALKPLPSNPNLVTLQQAGMRAQVGDLVLVGTDNDVTKHFAARVRSLTPRTGEDGGKYIDALLDQAPSANGFIEADQRALYLQRAGSSAKPWSAGGAPSPVSLNPDGTWNIVLDTVYRQINPSDWVILDTPSGLAATQILQTSDKQVARQVSSSVSTTTQGGATAQSNVTATAQIPTTLLLLPKSPRPPGNGSVPLVVRFAWSRIASAAYETAAWLGSADLLALITASVPPDGSSPSRLSLADVNGIAVAGSASVDLAGLAVTAFTPDGGAARPALQMPVFGFGNLITASRGATVAKEVLGSGDASQSFQSFTLQKKPLTYLPDQNGPNLVAALRIWVDGVAWREVATLYNVVPGTPVYMVRTDTDGAATITFPHLPSGLNNVVATYRFGAGVAVPPGGTVRQIARPVPGLVSASNPLAAFGGEDAEAPTRVRHYAPRWALQFGRAVSLADMEAIAAGTSGVRAARASWGWSVPMQRPVAQIVYVGDAALADQIAQALGGSTDPATPIEVSVATVVPVVLSLQLALDPDYVAGEVLAALNNVLTADLDGMLVPEQLGIGVPLYRSQLEAAVMAVPGVTNITALNWNGGGFDKYAQTPGDDGAFDFLTAGDVVLNGVGRHG
jgi:hypothetical protein